MLIDQMLTPLQARHLGISVALTSRKKLLEDLNVEL